MNESQTVRDDAPLVLILGLGETGVAAARWCAREGARLRVADTRAEPGGLAELRSALEGGGHDVEYRLDCGSAFDAALLDGVSQLVLSPGLVPGEEPAQSLLAAARERGVEIVGEIELFARALAMLAQTREYRPRLLAVTGTNGKTTVTSLTRHLIEASGLSARAAGNISPAALTALMDALDGDDLPQVWVIELSSFQLETTRSLAADAAVVLNVTQDHLDWHGSMEAYAQAKARLLGMARVAIVNRADPLTTAMVPALQGLAVRSFGGDLPELVGDMGLDLGQGVAWLASCEANDFDEPVVAPTRVAASAAPARAATTSTPSAPTTSAKPADAPLTHHEALTTILALQSKVRPDQIGRSETIDGLFDGVSSRRNQVLVDIGAEFDLGTIDRANETPLADFALEVEKRARRWKAPGSYLAQAYDEALKKAFARVFRKPDPGYVDVAKALPVTYVLAAVLIVMGGLLIYADVFNPIRFKG